MRLETGDSFPPQTGSRCGPGTPGRGQCTTGTQGVGDGWGQRGGTAATQTVRSISRQVKKGNKASHVRSPFCPSPLLRVNWWHGTLSVTWPVSFFQLHSIYSFVQR